MSTTAHLKLRKAERAYGFGSTRVHDACCYLKMSENHDGSATATTLRFFFGKGNQKLVEPKFILPQKLK